MDANETAEIVANIVEVDYADVKVGDRIVFTIDDIGHHTCDTVTATIDDIEEVTTVNAEFVHYDGTRGPAIGFANGYMIDPTFSPVVLVDGRNR